MIPFLLKNRKSFICLKETDFRIATSVDITSIYDILLCTKSLALLITPAPKHKISKLPMYHSKPTFELRQVICRYKRTMFTFLLNCSI